MKKINLKQIALVGFGLVSKVFGPKAVFWIFDTLGDDSL